MARVDYRCFLRFCYQDFKGSFFGFVIMRFLVILFCFLLAFSSPALAGKLPANCRTENNFEICIVALYNYVGVQSTGDNLCYIAELRRNLLNDSARWNFISSASRVSEKACMDANQIGWMYSRYLPTSAQGEGNIFDAIVLLTWHDFLAFSLYALCLLLFYFSLPSGGG